MKLGLCGYAQVGKDTAAAHLPTYRRYAFADALKRDASKMLVAVGVDADWSDPIFKERWRPLLVALGAGMRATDPNYWIKRLIYQLAVDGVGPRDDIVISDVRYANEIQWILGQKGVVVKVGRHGYVPANAEESRSFLEIYQTYPRIPSVINDGTPADLAQKILVEVQRYRGHSVDLLPNVPGMGGTQDERTPKKFCK